MRPHRRPAETRWELGPHPSDISETERSSPSEDSTSQDHPLGASGAHGGAGPLLSPGTNRTRWCQAG